MAVKSITLKRKGLLRNEVSRLVAIQLDNGNYTQLANGGLTVDFTTMANPKKIQHGKFGGVASSSVPLPGNDDIIAGQDVQGYSVVVQQAAANPTFKNYTLAIYTSGGTELAAGAMPAVLQAVDILYEIRTPLKYD